MLALGWTLAYWPAVLLGQAERPSITSGDLEIMLGTFKGIVRYTEPKDEGRVRINPTLMVATARAKGGLLFGYFYSEPSYQPFEDMSEFIPQPNSRIVRFDGEWVLTQKRYSNDSLFIVLQAFGRENRKRAAFRIRFTVTTDSLIHEQTVRYRGTEQYLMRYRYELARQRE
jgi:hypothetical protein